MHVLIVCLYGWTIWLSALAYTLLADGPFWVVAACGPFIITGAMIAIWALDFTLSAMRGLWAGRTKKSDART